MNGLCVSTNRKGCQQTNGLRALTGDDRAKLSRMIDIESKLLHSPEVPHGGSEQHVLGKAIDEKTFILSRGSCGPGSFKSYDLWFWVVDEDKARMDSGVHHPELYISRRVLEGGKKCPML